MTVFSLIKEESRIALIVACITLAGVILNACFTAYETHGENRRVQLAADRKLAYVQLKGEQAEFLILFKQFALAHDQHTFYQARFAQLEIAGTTVRPSSRKTKEGLDLRGTYLSDAMQQERNSEHYSDELVGCAEKMFESIGLIQLSFKADPELEERITRVEKTLVETEDVLPHESPRDGLIWALATEDSDKEISDRQKQHLRDITTASEPIRELLVYLQEQIGSDSNS